MKNAGGVHGSATDLVVTRSPLLSPDSRFSQIASSGTFLKKGSINNAKRKQMCQVCDQKRGYSRRHQLLEVNNSPDSTKPLSRHLTLSRHLARASAGVNICPAARGGT